MRGISFRTGNVVPNECEEPSSVTQIPRYARDDIDALLRRNDASVGLCS